MAVIWILNGIFWGNLKRNILHRYTSTHLHVSSTSKYMYIFFGWYLFASKTFDSFKEIVYKCVADGKIDKEFNDWRREKRIRDFIKPFKRILMVTLRRYHSRHISNRANNLSIITLLYCYLFPKWIIKMLVDVLPKTQ